MASAARTVARRATVAGVPRPIATVVDRAHVRRAAAPAVEARARPAPPAVEARARRAAPAVEGRPVAVGPRSADGPCPSPRSTGVPTPAWAGSGAHPAVG